MWLAIQRPKGKNPQLALAHAFAFALALALALALAFAVAVAVACFTAVILSEAKDPRICRCFCSCSCSCFLPLPLHLLLPPPPPSPVSRRHPAPSLPKGNPTPASTLIVARPSHITSQAAPWEGRGFSRAVSTTSQRGFSRRGTLVQDPPRRAGSSTLATNKNQPIVAYQLRKIAKL